MVVRRAAGPQAATTVEEKGVVTHRVRGGLPAESVVRPPIRSGSVVSPEPKRSRATTKQWLVPAAPVAPSSLPTLFALTPTPRPRAPPTSLPEAFLPLLTPLGATAPRLSLPRVGVWEQRIVLTAPSRSLIWTRTRPSVTAGVSGLPAFLPTAGSGPGAVPVEVGSRGVAVSPRHTSLTRVLRALR